MRLSLSTVTRSNRANFALLNLLVKNKVESWLLGPDSMKIDHNGNIYVAQWSGGKVLKISPQGKLINFIPIPEDTITNNAFGGPDMKTLYVTAGKTLYKVRTEIAGLPR